MRIGFYPKLAMTGMQKNRKLYVPYLLTCVGMVIMYYIISFLSVSRNVSAMYGGADMQMVLGLGGGVITVFAVIFLFYTNSFLIRRRKKEFGLYNILGMGKRNLCRVLLWENLFTAGIAVVIGLICGILFSKIAELCMGKILQAEVNYSLTVEISAIRQTILVFCGIFLLLLLNGIRQIYITKPIELLGSEAVGEKPPKANWLGAVLGVVLLAGAYYLAISIEEPISAMIWFFVAVIMVIIATYLLFISGSVALCRLLQKNKTYYYKTNHFVSVSSMVYRMKRNGAGLASICILSTMVLVMLSSTTGMFIGQEDTLRNRYPRNIVIDTYSVEDAYTEKVHEIIRTSLDEKGVIQENVLYYQYLDVAGYKLENQIIFDMNKVTDFSMKDYGDVRQLFIVPIADYNRLMGEEITLQENEALLYTTKSDYGYDTITIEGCDTMKIKAVVPEFVDNGYDAMVMVSSMFLFVQDMDVIEEIYEIQAKVYGEDKSAFHDYYGFDLSCDKDTMMQLTQRIGEQVRELQMNDESFPPVSTECVEQDRQIFYALYGGLFFLGILLGIVFILAAVLIIYYKQISEGYEDQERFLIMQKVGMTKREIRKSVNSQVLTVFFLPLIAAGIHTAFAFPMVSKVLLLFNLTNTPLLAATAVGSYLLFVIFYIVIYRLTSGAYFKIVST